MNSIEVRDAVKSYDSRTSILNRLNLTVKTGSIYGLIGPSGCGKTTLLSSILGMKKLDGGTIKILGEEVSYEKPSKFPHIIGYMPQETALVPELTIKETLQYFGNIYQMNPALLKEKLVMICDLLELNDVNKRVEHLSGGGKRRVSFAAALIHDPKILILDEPTVGLDSILRDKIWAFLLDSTSSSNMSVIITTHYIAEAEKSNCCGLMRNGILLAEDNPRNIFRSLGVSNLEEAFLTLVASKSQIASNYSNTINFDDTRSNRSNEQSKSSLEMLNFAELTPRTRGTNNYIFDKRRNFCTQTLKALFKKELIRVYRQPAEIAFTFIFPIVLIFSFAFSMGKYPNGLQLAIVNEEIKDSNFCSEYLKSTNYTFNTSSCYFEHLSCHFLNAIEDEAIAKIYYNSFDEAFKDAKAAKTYGIISISSNFTDVMSERKFDWQPINRNVTFSNQIAVNLDHTNLEFTSYLQTKLWKAFERFNKKMLRHCHLDERLEDFPLKEETFYGTLDNDHTSILFPALFGQAILLGGILFSISCISQNRVEGIWNRTLLAGVTTSEILVTHILLLVTSDLIQICIFKATITVLLDIQIIGNEWLLGIFCLVMFIAGNSIGLFISILTNNVLVINGAGLVTVFGCSNLCGGFWPIEGMHPILKYISYITPLTLPSVTIRNIVVKGFSITHYTVYGGFLLLFGWIVLVASLTFLILGKRKFTE